jgi:hypothetical protein
MATTHTARTAVVVTNFPERDALDIVVAGPDIDVAVFESPANAYARIKREQPTMVIVCLSFDSMMEFLLLTMLQLDRDTAGIPIWTCANLREARRFEVIDFGRAGASCCSSSYSRLS